MKIRVINLISIQPLVCVDSLYRNEELRVKWPVDEGGVTCQRRYKSDFWNFSYSTLHGTETSEQTEAGGLKVLPAKWVLCDIKAAGTQT